MPVPAAPSGCPSEAALQAWARGEASPGMASHLAACPRCRTLIEAAPHATWGQADTLVSSPGGEGPEPGAARVFPLTPGRFDAPGGLLELGRGGLGQVLLLRDQALGREVAVKVLGQLPPEAHAAVEARFIREACLSAQLEHPGIVPLYDFGRDEQGRLMAVMRRIGGRTLAAAIAAAPDLEARVALVPHLLALAHAVAYAHSRGVIHRDIKPQNVMVGAFGETLLLDWGLARSTQTADAPLVEIDSGEAFHTRQGAAMGTPAYMSPEQALGQLDQIDAQSDVFALGAILYEVLAGRAPYASPTLEGALALARVGAVPPLALVAPDAPRELAAVAHRCLAREKSGRYADAKAFLADLERYLSGRRVQAYDYSTLERARRIVRRHRVPLAAAVIVLAVVVGAAITTHLRVLRERNHFRSLAAFVLKDTMAAIKDTPGSHRVVQELAARVQEVLRDVGTGRDLPREDRAQLRLALSQLAEAQLAQGGVKDALGTYELVVALSRELFDEDPSVDPAIDLGNDLSEYAMALHQSQRDDAGLQALEEATAALARARRLAPGRVEVDMTESLLVSYRVVILDAQGRWPEALEWARRGMVIDSAMAPRVEDNPRTRFNRMAGFAQLADLARLVGHRDEAARAAEGAQQALDELRARFPSSSDAAEAVVEVAGLRARLALDEGRLAEVRAARDEARRAIEGLVGHEPENADYVRLLLVNQMERQDLEAALRTARGALALQDLTSLRPTLALTFLLAEPPDQALAHPETAPPGLARAMTAALAGQPQQALVALGQDPQRAALSLVWVPELLVQRLTPGTPGGVDLVRALALELDATERSPDLARRRRAVAVFGAGLEAWARDGGEGGTLAPGPRASGNAP